MPHRCPVLARGTRRANPSPRRIARTRIDFRRQITVRPQGRIIMTTAIRHRSAAAFVAAICLATLASAGADKPIAVPKAVAAAVADAARPQADRDRDADRKPAECIAFAGLKPGQRVADLIPGGGYFTRIFSGVVGPKGEVFAVAPPRRPDAPPDRPEPAAATRAIAA